MLSLLASTGLRAMEALSIRLKDLDFNNNPAKLTIRGKYTKTKVNFYNGSESVLEIRTFLMQKYEYK